MYKLLCLGVNVFSAGADTFLPSTDTFSTGADTFLLGADPFCQAMRIDSIFCLIELILCQYYSGVSVNVRTKNLKSPHLFKDFYS
jgi:hypothetical protein